MQALHVRFGSITYDDLMEVLTRLRQSLIMAMYQVEFEVVSNRIKRLSPLHKPSCFLSGLKDEIRLLVRMLNPSTLNEAYLDWSRFKRNMCSVARKIPDFNKK